MSFDHLAWAMRHAEVQSSTQRLVLLALADAVRPGMDFCWPSQETLAATVKLNADSVGRTIRQLEELGLVRIVKRFHDDGRRKPNAYYLPHIELVAAFNSDEKSPTKTHPTQTRVVHDSHPTLTLEPDDAGSDKQVHKSNNQQASPFKPPKGGRMAVTPPIVGDAKYSREFEEFWECWPKGKGGTKAKGYQAWLKLNLDDADKQAERTRLHFDLDQRKQFHQPWIDGFAIPHVSSYLNGGGWTADIDTSTGPKTNGRAKTSYEQVMEASERNRAALREDYDAMSDDEQRTFRAAFGHG